MTGTQKQNIQDMRRQGAAFSQIAASLGISVNTVKSFCRRNDLTACDASKETGNKENKEQCKQCGIKLNQIPRAKPKLFCCDSCRMAWWKANPAAVNRKAVYQFKCAVCGASFESYGNAHRKYCSRACFGAARRTSNG